MLDIIFICSLPFFAYLLTEGSFKPTITIEILSVDPRAIASNNKAYELLLYHSSLLKPDS